MVQGGAQPAAGTSKRKRKAPAKSDDQRTTQQPAKRSKTRAKVKGLLQQVLDMPFDILFEIFGHLLPMDLLSLGRVSKEFRQLVMSPGFKSIWIQSRSHFPDSPGCPEDMTEPMFAELVFGRSCLMCKRNGPSVHTVWQARTRLCTNCVKDSYVSAAFIRRLKLPRPIQNMVPFIHVSNRTNYSQTHAKKWADEYHSLSTNKEKAEWQEKKLEYLLSMKKHAERCQEWMREVETFLANEAAEEKTERKARMTEIAKSMGWADELSRMTKRALPYDSDIDEICQKPLTDASIETAKTVINQIMQKIQDTRLENEKIDLYKHRMQVLQTSYNRAVGDWIPSAEVPHISDVFIVPRIRSIVIDTPPEITLTAEDFFDKDKFLGVVEEAKAIRKAKFLKLVEEGYKSMKKEYDPTTVSQLATTAFGVFRNGLNLDHDFLTEANALAHRTTAYWVNDNNLDPVERIAVGVFQRRPWNSDNAVVFHCLAHEVICILVTMCNLDPATTTLDAMNSADPIFECVSCNTMYRGRLMLRWAATVPHILHRHETHLKADLTNVESNFLKIPDSEDLERARKGIKEAEERRAYSDNVEMQCKHCNLRMRLHEMRRHLFNEHTIEYPTDNDWLYTQAVPKVQEHWMWPPRPPFN